MPTGYTWDIKDEITFEQFIMNCARAFGALVEMRDEPRDKKIPDELKPSDYHNKELSKHQMVEQISISIEFDCDVSYYCDSGKPLTGKEWVAKKIQQLTEDIDYHTKQHKEEIERVAGRNKWLRQLRNSIKEEEK